MAADIGVLLLSSQLGYLSGKEMFLIVLERLGDYNKGLDTCEQLYTYKSLKKKKVNKDKG